MSEHHPLTLDERRERLVLACELDRLKLRLALRPSPLERLTISVIEKIAPLAPHLPGRLGRWTRGIMQGTSMVRDVYEAFSR
jgi:hypothetical protein